MAVKKPRSITLSDGAYEIAKEHKKNCELSSISETIEQMIITYKDMQEKVNILEEREKKNLTRIRLGANGADRKSEQILEMLNAFAFVLKVPSIANSLETPSQLFITTKKTVDKRIAERHAKAKKKNKKK